MNEFSFGAGVLIATRQDVANSTPIQFAGLQEGSVEFSATTKTAYGSFQFPIAAARGKSTIKCKSKAVTINGALISDLHFGQSVTPGQLMQAYREAQLVPTTGLTSSPALAIGGTTTAVASGAFAYDIAGVAYNKLAVAAGTALAAGTVPQSKWGIYLFSINAAGTIAVTAGAGNGTGYDTEAAAIADLPATPGSSVSMGYVTVKNTNSGGFVAGTTALTGAGITGNFYSSALTFTVSATNAQYFEDDLGVEYADTLLALKKVAVPSAAGEYSVSNGVYTFSSAETDLNVLLSYTYTYAAAGSRIVVANPLMGINPVFQAVLRTQYTGPSGVQSFLLKLHACVSEKLSFATKLDDFMIPEFDFEAFADASNNIFTGSWL